MKKKIVNPIELIRKQVKQINRTKDKLIEMQPKWITAKEDSILEYLR